MTVVQVLILAVVSALVGHMSRGRSLALLGLSTLVVFWLQPYQEPVNLMFWMPSLTIGVAALIWAVTSNPNSRSLKENWKAVVVLAGVIIIVWLNRYLQLDYFFSVETPRLRWVFTFILVTALAGVGLSKIERYRKMLLAVAVVGIILLLVSLKIPSVLPVLLDAFAELRGKTTGGVSGFAWLGFSYVSFRLLHTILDRIAGRLPPLPLADYMNYVIFFPSFTAGPIDRVERFTKDLANPSPLDNQGLMDAGGRLFMGLFKKFVLADGLGWIALNEPYLLDARSTAWIWVLLYAYSLQIFLDFSGYTDIAIGLGRLMGIRLPENFNAPYLKPNLTQFWNSWHMTLTQWFRSYFFNPLTRRMRAASRPLPIPSMILLSQLATMILIGLWHGITYNFFLWGAWHGLGLFIQNRWSNWTRPFSMSLADSPRRAMLIEFTGVFLTFNFVSIGWLFFILPDPPAVWVAMSGLVGVR